MRSVQKTTRLIFGTWFTLAMVVAVGLGYLIGGTGDAVATAIVGSFVGIVGVVVGSRILARLIDR